MIDNLEGEAMVRVLFIIAETRGPERLWVSKLDPPVPDTPDVRFGYSPFDFYVLGPLPRHRAYVCEPRH
jgi:hypothetical protein